MRFFILVALSAVAVISAVPVAVPNEDSAAANPTESGSSGFPEPTGWPTGIPSGFPTPPGFPTGLPSGWPTGFPTPTDGFPSFSFPPLPSGTGEPGFPPTGLPTGIPGGFPTGLPGESFPPAPAASAAITSALPLSSLLARIPD
ncbi:hypothetical protein DICSQDRAFT_174173 [Dichomitus squalens LYAD-421 SS1]|uniref:Uncharacterized protein n=1 Tax=Dichomitus squalens (strain LYAD-421) TaxID=732165 RepID=R7SM74_DICSQ|nr:uncharacterized protein DICSQDRAFT_174173 [Dichomitus squalens LYAD-421 SS1]EJF57221.1 hypothetical protein DICSQDRAFT_174173 [Dichomitus squalens LYAD-421 SS1]